MNIDKAIEVNKSLLDGTYDHRDEEMEEALKLGIEALHRLKYLREYGGPIGTASLPSETKE